MCCILIALLRRCELGLFLVIWGCISPFGSGALAGMVLGVIGRGKERWEDGVWGVTTGASFVYEVCG